MGTSWFQFGRMASHFQGFFLCCCSYFTSEGSRGAAGNSGTGTTGEQSGKGEWFGLDGTLKTDSVCHPSRSEMSPQVSLEGSVSLQAELGLALGTEALWAQGEQCPVPATQSSLLELGVLANPALWQLTCRWCYVSGGSKAVSKKGGEVSEIGSLKFIIIFPFFITS